MGGLGVNPNRSQPGNIF